MNGSFQIHLNLSRVNRIEYVLFIEKWARDLPDLESMNLFLTTKYKNCFHSKVITNDIQLPSKQLNTQPL